MAVKSWRLPSRRKMQSRPRQAFSSLTAATGASMERTVFSVRHLACFSRVTDQRAKSSISAGAVQKGMRPAGMAKKASATVTGTVTVSRDSRPNFSRSAW